MANFKYSYSLSDFPNNKVDLDTLQDQVRNSAISISLDYINSSLSVVDFYFRAELDSTNQSMLDSIVSIHDGTPEVQDIPIVQSNILTEYIDFVESGNTTQGRFAAKSLVIDISSGESEKIVDFSWPYDIALMSGTLSVIDSMVGDEVIIEVGPNTLIGALISPLNVGDTSVYVSDTVISNIKIGYYLELYNPSGDTGYVLGQVYSKDIANNCLEIGTPSDTSANAGSYVSTHAKIVPELYLHSADKIEIGKQIPTGQRIMKGTPVRVHYFNNTNTAKKISFFVEYLY